MPPSTLTFSLPPSEQERLLEHIATGNYEQRSVAHSRAAVKKENLNLVLYNSGKLVVQGKGAEDWVQFVLEPVVLQRILPATTGDGSVAAEGSPEGFAEHIGIDESGKGDYFGPLVIAAAYVSPSLEVPLGALGLRDSKRIKSDDRIHRIANALRSTKGFRYEELILKPATYNRMIGRMGSVNRVLAWGHATVLENLLKRVPDCPKAVADQFGPEHQIDRALKTRGRGIELIQRHKAESDPAVAAASILARDRFVQGLKELASVAGRELPKGATTVRPVAEAIVQAKGEAMLNELCKTHFRTTQQVLDAVKAP